MADAHDVSTEHGAGALVATALDSFGRVDVVVNNAGIIRWAGFPDADAENIERHLAVHVLGSFHTARAAWPHLVEQGYGRIVNTTSSGMFGLPNNVGYATAKAGVVGLIFGRNMWQRPFEEALAATRRVQEEVLAHFPG